MKNKEIIAVLEFENPNYKRLFLILSFIMISFIYSPKIMAQIEGLYNQNDEQFAGISNLMSAVSNNDVEGTRFFAKAGSIIVNQKNKGGATALHIVSREGNLDIVKILIDSGANLNLADNEGYTPLMRASLSANYDVFDYLLKNGAKPEIFNTQNETVIIHASTSKCHECLNSLIENGQIIKNVDTLILKGQIADAIVIANNQDNEKTQNILYGFLDYVSKTAQLVVKTPMTPIAPVSPIKGAKNSEYSSSNIFENEQNNSSIFLEKNQSFDKPVEFKELPTAKNDSILNKDNIKVPVKKFTLKKEIDHTQIPVYEEKITKISQPEINSTPIQMVPEKKFKFAGTSKENSKPIEVNKASAVVNENGSEKTEVKKYKFKSLNSMNTSSQTKASPEVSSVNTQEPKVETLKTSALDATTHNQQFEINVNKSEIVEQKTNKEVKKFIFKQQIDKAN